MIYLPLREVILLVILLGLYPCALCAAIGMDLARRKVPNVLVGALLAGFAVLALLSHLPDLSLRLLVTGSVTAVGFTLFSEDLIGAGDAKLAGALMLWLDPLQVPAFALLSGLFGALLAVGAMARLRLAGPAALSAVQPSLPYAVALAGAGLLLLPYSSLMQLF